MVIKKKYGLCLLDSKEMCCVLFSVVNLVEYFDVWFLVKV